MKALVIILLSGLFFLSCESEKKNKVVQATEEISHSLTESKEIEPLSPRDYVKWVDQNLHSRKTINEYVYSLNYTPMPYKILKRYGAENYNQYSKENKDNSQYYTLSIYVGDAKESALKYQLSATDEYYARIEYLSFGISNDIQLINKKDTTDCSLNIFERDYNLSPIIKEVITFDKNDSLVNGDRVIVYEDRLFGNGMIKFRFKEELLKQIPKVKL